MHGVDVFIAVWGRLGMCQKQPNIVAMSNCFWCSLETAPSVCQMIGSVGKLWSL